MRRRFRSGELRASISGRWAARRVRVEECWSVLTAELVYTSLLADPDAILAGRVGVGRSAAQLECPSHSRVLKHCFESVVTCMRLPSGSVPWSA